MQENLIVAPPDFKLYKERAVYIGTFLGGPLAAGYLIGENYRQLGLPDKMRQAWAVSIAFTALLFGAAFFIPGLQKAPHYMVPLLYSALAQFFIQKFQGAAIADHIKKGGAVYTIGRAVWISLIGLVIMLAGLFAIIMANNSWSF